jgi:hypothetical protein
MVRHYGRDLLCAAVSQGRLEAWYCADPMASIIGSCSLKAVATKIAMERGGHASVQSLLPYQEQQRGR